MLYKQSRGSPDKTFNVVDLPPYCHRVDIGSSHHVRRYSLSSRSIVQAILLYIYTPHDITASSRHHTSQAMHLAYISLLHGSSNLYISITHSRQYLCIYFFFFPLLMTYSRQYSHTSVQDMPIHNTRNTSNSLRSSNIIHAIFPSRVIICPSNTISLQEASQDMLFQFTKNPSNTLRIHKNTVQALPSYFVT